MSYSKVSKGVALVLALLLTLVAFVPIGVYLQWFAPQDFPPFFGCIYPSTSAPILAVALTVWHKSRTKSRMQWPMRVGAICLFLFCALWLVTTSFPPISRRVGPWAELREMLIEKSRDVVDAKVALSIPAHRQLTRQEMDQIESMLFDPVPTYTFPIINQTVQVRVMRSVPPYVGVDFGGGRRAVFDLATMVVIYAD